MRGHKIKELGILQYDHQLTLTMYETVDNVITDWIDAWKEACWKSNTGVQKAKQDVESIVLLSRLDRQNEIIRTYELIGCFLEDYDNGGELGSESDVVKPQLILSYDYFTITR